MKRKSRITRKNFEADTKPGGSSEYAKKKAAGNQMYGPGCCANKLDIAAAQKRIADMNRKQALCQSQAA